MSLYDKLHGGPKGSAGEAQSLTAKQFLGIDGDNGYTTCEVFLVYAKSLRKPEVDDLGNVIHWMKAGHPIDDHHKIRHDKAEREYAYPRFRLSGKSNPGGKVILEAGMDRLLSDYASGLVEVDFTLDELVEEALNS